MAALAVTLAHLRAFALVNFAEANHPGLFWSAIYFATGFGSQAVMVFFVLSGFLVGGAVVQRIEALQWSWTDYAITRMTRLWIVLIPALLLTALWDNMGMALTGSSFYSGQMIGRYAMGPADDPTQYTIGTLFGNLAFLQGIAVPTFGSNAPLWSLAYEFWYYLIFPLLFCALMVKARLNFRVGAILLALGICYVLPGIILRYGFIWLFGVAAFVAHDKWNFTARHRNMLLAASGAVFAAALTLSRLMNLGEPMDFAVGGAFALMLLPLTRLQPRNMTVGWLSHLTAEFSYSLYLVHFPFAAFLACYLLHNQRLGPGLAGGAVFAGLIGITLSYSFAVYFLFERNTAVVRHAISQLAVKFAAPGGSKENTL